MKLAVFIFFGGISSLPTKLPGTGLPGRWRGAITAIACGTSSSLTNCPANHGGYIFPQPISVCKGGPAWVSPVPWCVEGFKKPLLFYFPLWVDFQGLSWSAWGWQSIAQITLCPHKPLGADQVVRRRKEGTFCSWSMWAENCSSCVAAGLSSLWPKRGHWEQSWWWCFCSWLKIPSPGWTVLKTLKVNKRGGQ